MDFKTLSAVIPCYNEERTLETIVGHLLAANRKGSGLEGGIVLVQDADLEYSPNDYPKLRGPILDGRADVVFGSRYNLFP